VTVEWEERGNHPSLLPFLHRTVFGKRGERETPLRFNISAPGAEVIVKEKKKKKGGEKNDLPNLASLSPGSGELIAGKSRKGGVEGKNVPIPSSIILHRPVRDGGGKEGGKEREFPS